MKKITSRQIALNGLVAGLYAAVTILTASFAYGNIQFRIAEALCPLVALEPSLTIGLTLGCLIANLFSTVSALDIIVGTAATLLACLLTRYIKKVWALPLPTTWMPTTSREIPPPRSSLPSASASTASPRSSARP